MDVQPSTETKGVRMNAEELYSTVCDLSLNAHEPSGAARLHALVEAEWPRVSEREANAEDAEVCRLAMLASAQRQDFRAVRLWRARALARFASIGWVEGVAYILMSEALEELARENDDYARGQTLDLLKPSVLALGILAEMERFAVGPGSGFQLGSSAPSQMVVKRLYHEKRGFLLLLSGAFDEAGASYDRAYEAAGTHKRGQVKVRLGRCLVDYLAADSADVRDRIAQQTDLLHQEALDASSLDVAQTAELNAKVMRRGGLDLIPYEIL